MDYFDMLNRHLLRPLMEGDVKGTIQSMDEYCVTRTDLVEVLNAMVLGEGKYRFDKVPSKTKSAFTRAYNSQTHVVSNVFADDASMFRKVTKGKKEKKSARVKENEEEEEDSEEVFLDYWCVGSTNNGKNHFFFFSFGFFVTQLSPQEQHPTISTNTNTI